MSFGGLGFGDSGIVGESRAWGLFRVVAKLINAAHVGSHAARFRGSAAKKGLSRATHLCPVPGFGFRVWGLGFRA